MKKVQEIENINEFIVSQELLTVIIMGTVCVVGASWSFYCQIENLF